MSEMVSRVAEALAQSFRDTVARVSGESWEETGVTLPSKEVFERYARTAIEAMSPPTDRMMAMGEHFYLKTETGLMDVSDPLHEAYCRMIDEALK